MKIPERVIREVKEAWEIERAKWLEEEAKCTDAMKKSYLTKKDYDFINYRLDGILETVCDIECAGYDGIYDRRLEIIELLKEITDKEDKL